MARESISKIAYKTLQQSKSIAGFAHKQKMEKMYGPCEWKYVGKQTDIKNPAIPLKPPVGENYVLFRQVCENDPHRKD